MPHCVPAAHSAAHLHQGKVLPTSRRPHTSTAEDPPHRPHGLCCFCLEFPPRRRRSAPQSWRHVVSAQKGLLEPLLSYSLCSWGLGPGLPSGIHFLSFPSEWGSQRLEVSHVHKVECVIPWLNDALVYFTVSLQLCQQLKDKVCAGPFRGLLPLPKCPQIVKPIRSSHPAPPRHPNISLRFQWVRHPLATPHRPVLDQPPPLGSSGYTTPGYTPPACL